MENAEYLFFIRNGVRQIMNDFENNEESMDYLPGRYDEELHGREKKEYQKKSRKKKKTGSKSIGEGNQAMDGILALVTMAALIFSVLAGSIAFIYSWISETFLK